MSYRKLLVPLLGDARDTPGLSGAMSVAKLFGAHVVGLIARPDPSEALPYMGEGLTGSVVQELLDAARKAADAAEQAAGEALRTAAASAGIALEAAPGARGEATAALLVRAGRLDEVVEREGLLSDLIVIGMRGDETGRLRDALESALMSSGRPVLLLPAEPPRSFGARPAIAYDGGSAAANAVMAALPFLMRAGRGDLYFATPGAKSDTTLDPLRDYLALRGVACTEHVIDPGEMSIGAALIDAAARGGADLLVMGGYGHSRLREFVLGGVTRHVLSTRAPMPVLMAH